MKQRQFVVPVGNKWGVRGGGNDRLTVVCDTQHDAIDAGRPIAQNQKTELVIMNRRGQFREAYSYGHDPFPPRG